MSPNGCPRGDFSRIGSKLQDALHRRMIRYRKKLPQCPRPT